MTEPTGLGLDGALSWVGHRRLSGALEVVGDRAAGTLFFHEGSAVFGLLDGDSCVPATGGGIDPDLWLAALASPVADIDFAAALMLAGASATRVERFALRAIDAVVKGLRVNSTMNIRFVDRKSPFGTIFRFDLSNRLRHISVVDHLEHDTRRLISQPG